MIASVIMIVFIFMIKESIEFMTVTVLMQIFTPLISKAIKSEDGVCRTCGGASDGRDFSLCLTVVIVESESRIAVCDNCVNRGSVEDLF